MFFLIGIFIISYIQTWAMQEDSSNISSQYTQEIIKESSLAQKPSYRHMKLSPDGEFIVVEESFKGTQGFIGIDLNTLETELIPSAVQCEPHNEILIYKSKLSHSLKAYNRNSKYTCHTYPDSRGLIRVFCCDNNIPRFFTSQNHIIKIWDIESPISLYTRKCKQKEIKKITSHGYHQIASLDTNRKILISDTRYKTHHTSIKPENPSSLKFPTILNFNTCGDKLIHLDSSGSLSVFDIGQKKEEISWSFQYPIAHAFFINNHQIAVHLKDEDKLMIMNTAIASLKSTPSDTAPFIELPTETRKIGHIKGEIITLSDKCTITKLTPKG